MGLCNGNVNTEKRAFPVLLSEEMFIYACLHFCVRVCVCGRHVIYNYMMISRFSQTLTVFFPGLPWNVKHQANALFIRKRRSVRLRSNVCEELITISFSHFSRSSMFCYSSNLYIYRITNITQNNFTQVITINPQIREVWSRRNAPHAVQLCARCCVV